MLLSTMLWLGCRTLAVEPPDEKTQAERRERLVEKLSWEIGDRRVLDALRRVPRHRFVPESQLHEAYGNYPLPIGQGQTISQPFIVAYMSERLKLKGKEKVLEIGTGSGYQAAVLAELAGAVYTIEIIPELSRQARQILVELGYKNIFFRVGDGYLGWPEAAPFDGIMVTAAPLAVPAPLVEQLKEGGRLVIPLGPYGRQELKTFIKRLGRLEEIDSLPVAFVPMTGRARDVEERLHEN